MENYNNVEMSGKIFDVSPAFQAKSGKIVTRCYIETCRLSLIKDIVPLTIPEDVISHNQLVNIAAVPNNCVTILGEIRTSNSDVNGKRSLVQYVYVSNVVEELPDEPLSVNFVKITGYVCRKPEYRHTPTGRVIVDLFIAHNPDNKKVSYYIPCIAWGNLGLSMVDLPVGTKLVLTGRYQSRTYEKTLDNDEKLSKTILELSISSYDLED